MAHPKEEELFLRDAWYHMDEILPQNDYKFTSSIFVLPQKIFR